MGWGRTILSLGAVAVAVAACEHGPGDACVPEEATYSVTAQVSLDESVDQGPAKTTADPFQGVLATVSEASSISACGNGLASLQSPGTELVSNRPVAVDAAGFTLRFSSRFYPELQAPAPLALEVVLDENANGRCDDGEPSGHAPLQRALGSRVSVALTRGPCRVRL